MVFCCLFAYVYSSIFLANGKHLQWQGNKFDKLVLAQVPNPIEGTWPARITTKATP